MCMNTLFLLNTNLFTFLEVKSRSYDIIRWCWGILNEPEGISGVTLIQETYNNNNENGSQLFVKL